MKKIITIIASVLIATSVMGSTPVFADTSSTKPMTIEEFRSVRNKEIFLSYLKMGDFKGAKAYILHSGDGIISGTSPYVIGNPNNTLGIVYVSDNLAIYYLDDTLVNQYNSIGHIKLEYIDEATGKDIIPSTSITAELYKNDYTKPELHCSYDVSFSELKIPGYKLDIQNATTINEKGMKDLSIEQKTWVNLYNSTIPLSVAWFNTVEKPLILKLHYTKIDPNN